MPLPSNNTPWPPPQLQGLLPSLAIWSAWFSGNAEQLSSVYGGAANSGDPTAQAFFGSDTGGFKATIGRALQRWFWGEPTRGPNRRMKMHVPIAADLCQASADLLFADEPTITVEDEKTQARLADLMDEGMFTKLAEGAEVGAALGGVYLRVTWDDTVEPDRPFLTLVDVDQAIPEYKWDRLTAVTFWQVIARDGKTVWRHLERHELDGNGIGVIRHALYEGEEDNIGHVTELTAQPATAGLADLLGDGGVISTESPGLAVFHVPNQRPQRRWRTHSLGKNYGRSDLDGIEGLMDALDETYSSWMRDVRLGKARIMVAKSLLENQGPGNGSTFNADQEVYAPVEMLGKADNGMSDLMQQVQFNIRVAEHQATAQQLVEDILRNAGYSTQTFGEGDEGATRTATEVENKQQRSLLTRDRKIRLWAPKIADFVEKLLAVDAAVFRSGVTPSRPEVVFANGVQDSQLKLAQTALALFQADSASTEVRVAMLHPDWDDEQVKAEVKAIKDEQAAAMPPPLADPTSFDDPAEPPAV